MISIRKPVIGSSSFEELDKGKTNLLFHSSRNPLYHPVLAPCSSLVQDQNRPGSMKALFLVPVSLLAVLLAGCTAVGPGGSVTTLHHPDPPPQSTTLYSWSRDDGTGPVSIHINLGRQRLYVSREGRRIASTYVATGREGHDTPPGTFRVQEKVANKTSNRYGWIENSVGEKVDPVASPGDSVPSGYRYVPAPMPYWMRLTGTGIGLHAGYIPRPGTTASHGCIRMPERFAARLFDAVTLGTTVTIERGHYDPWVIHPDPLPRPQEKPRTRNGLRVISPDDPWIIWPEGHPRSR